MRCSTHIPPHMPCARKHALAPQLYTKQLRRAHPFLASVKVTVTASAAVPTKKVTQQCSHNYQHHLTCHVLPAAAGDFQDSFSTSWGVWQHSTRPGANVWKQQPSPHRQWSGTEISLTPSALAHPPCTWADTRAVLSTKQQQKQQANAVSICCALSQQQRRDYTGL